MMRVLRTWGLMLAFLTGGVFSGLHVLSFVIPYGVATMLTITFLGQSQFLWFAKKVHL